MFGLENIGQQSVVEAHATVNDLLTKLAPLLADVENRGGGILMGVLDRLNGTTIKIIDGGIQINIPPVPKATAVDQG